MSVTALNAIALEQTFDGPDDIEGEIFSTPSRPRASTLVLDISSNLDPGTFSFIVEVALKSNTEDGALPDNFVLLDTINNLMATDSPVGESYPDFAWDFVKVSQATKDNDVITTVRIKLA